MAKIKGIQLKAVKTMQGYDGIITTANVYLNNKKVGEIYDEGHGAGMYGHFNSSEIEEKLYSLAEEFYKEHPTYFIIDATPFGKVINFLEEELLLLHDLEKAYKKNVKQGYPVTLLLKTHNRDEDPFGEGMKYESPLFVGLKTWNDEVEKMIKTKYSLFKNIEVFKDLSDFIIE